MSAMPLIIDSLNSARHCVEFQLLKPIGGVFARPLSHASAGAWTVASPAAESVITAAAPNRRRAKVVADMRTPQRAGNIGGLTSVSKETYRTHVKTSCVTHQI